MDIIKIINEEIDGLSKGYIYHGTTKGAAVNIQRTGYMKIYDTGDKYSSISFTGKIDYARYYAKVKGGQRGQIILRTPLTSDFTLSDKIARNSGYEYVTFKEIPIDRLEVLVNEKEWKPLSSWDVIFNEPKAMNESVERRDMTISSMGLFDLEDTILNKIPNGCLYHGAKDISWLHNVSDIDTVSHTVNAESKYFFLAVKKDTAFNYSTSPDPKNTLQKILTKDSGISAFKLKAGSKFKKLGSSDYGAAKDYKEMESVLDDYRNKGYDYVINTWDANNHVILNNSILSLKGVYFNTPV